MKNYRKNKWMVKTRLWLVSLICLMMILSACDIVEKHTETPADKEPMVYNAGFISGYKGVPYAHYCKAAGKMALKKILSGGRSHAISYSIAVE